MPILQQATSLIFARSLSGLAAPALAAKHQASIPEYFVFLDEETVRAAATAEKDRLAAAAASRDRVAVPSVKEAVTFDLGARFTVHMKPSEAKVRASSRRGPRDASVDPFEGIPFRGLAEFLGGSYMGALEEAREEDKARKRASRAATTAVEEENDNNGPRLTLGLPITTLFARTDAFKDTFVVDDDKSKRRTRLSWYDPNDGMVPKNWLSDGLLADLRWYKPFAKGTGWD